MNNFFLDASDYELFKRALHETKNEPVVINIYSTDGSLQENENKDKKPVQRKSMSNKFEPSAFGRFFGPRKQRTAPVDMKDFSSWKNKNYRKTEQKLSEQAAAPTAKFSLADFMAEKAKANKFNELDQTRNEMQKPITQLSTEDPLYKKFSLDRYMHKLEEQTSVKGKFQENDDILEPISGVETQNVVPDSSQDENFGYTPSVDVEKFAFDDHISGDRFRFDSSELDVVKSRLEKMEREAANIKEKKSEKVISGNELSKLTKSEDDFDFEEDVKVAQEEPYVPEMFKEKDKETPKVDHKRFVEINKHEGEIKRRPRPAAAPVSEIDDEEFDDFDIYSDDDHDILDDEENVAKETEVDDEVLDEHEVPEPVEEEDLEKVDDSEDLEKDEELEIDTNEDVSDVDEPQDDASKFAVDPDEEDDLADLDEEENDEEIEPYEYIEQVPEVVPQMSEPVQQIPQSFVAPGQAAHGDVLTKSDFRSMTDEFINKFAQMYQKEPEQPVVQEPSVDYISKQEQEEISRVNQEEQLKLQAKINELVERNKIVDSENELKLKQAELEKERVAKEYESKIKELEESYQKNYEAFKKQAYLEKMDSDLKLQKAQSDFKKREIKIKEKEKALSKKNKDVALLRRELKSNLNISNLESDKKLLELTTKETKKKAKEKVEEVKTEVVETHEEVKTEEAKKTTASKPRRKTTTTRAKRKPRRKIDSDIIGGIDFE